MDTVAVVWMTLLLVLAAMIAALALPRRPVAGAAPAARVPLPRRGRPVVPAAAGRAEQLAAAARNAAETARLSRESWEQAQAEVDATWAAFDAAETEARRCLRAAAFPVLKQRRTRAEIADRERFLHRNALAACRRRELSIAQLNEALAHRGGWNARKHPVAQEAALRWAVRDHRQDRYRAAVERERAAWHESEQAAAVLRSLRAEALAATMTAGRDISPAGPRRAGLPAARPARTPVAVH
ncbi:hypothetical protein [Symbioplanes lichenis]|uniref:hypothetical protein n=1 Tax=Symbioplanes lichenis TaxID=1629072 RepID=UPI0027388DEE|nr:hypothetical protein [Actinoplanes lichenis]